MPVLRWLPDGFFLRVAVGAARKALHSGSYDQGLPNAM
jgi:hypothetical protein